MYPVEYSPAGSVVYCPFNTYGKTNGESITLTGLATSDIKIYKFPSMTERASTNGYTLLDTDGIDIDGITGFHAVSIDLADNSDAGFYVVGSWYVVEISTVTVDSQALSFTALKFRIMEAEGAGVPAVNLTHVNGTAIPTPAIAGVLPVDVAYNDGVAITAASGRQEVNLTHAGGSAISQSGGLLNANMTQISGDGPAADALEAMLDATGGVTLTADIDGTITSYPTNFALLAIDANGIVNADTKKINARTIVGDGTAPSPFSTTA